MCLLNIKKSSSSFHTKWKPGDWRCSCGFHNFANRTQCFRCGTRRLNATQDQVNLQNSWGSNWKPGDWNCAMCSTHNFAIRGSCFSCGVERKVSEANIDAKMKKHLVLDYIDRLSKKKCPPKGVSLKKKPVPLSVKEFKARNIKKSLNLTNKDIKETRCTTTKMQ